MRLLPSLLAGLLLAAAAPVVTAQASNTAAASPAAAASKPSKAIFGAGPASAKKVDGRPYYTYDASPGGVLVDHIAVINYATHALTLNVYTVDAKTGSKGTFVYPPRSAARRQVGAWISVVTPHNSGELSIGPRSTVILPVHLHVPSSASPGDHAGAVIVSLTSLVKNKNQQKIKFEQRIATRVIIRVSGPLHPRLSIQNLHATYSGSVSPFASGSVDVSYTVRNTGNVLLGARQQINVHGLFGSSEQAGPVSGVPLLLPGGSYQVHARVPGVYPEISITATVRLGPEGLRGDLNPATPVVTASVQLWAIPWLLVGVILLIALGIAALIWRRRRRLIAPARIKTDQVPEEAKS
jgi:hypothetical protein